LKKYCYIPTGNKVWLDVAIDLYDRGIAEPVFWLGDDCHYQKAKEYFGKAVFSRQDLIFYPERIKNISYQGENADFFLSENYLRAKDRCSKMMDRLDLYGTFSRLDREVIFNKLSMWILTKLDESKPDALVFSEAPHSHTYYLLYEICLYLNVNIVKFNTWLPVPLVFMQDVITGERYKKKRFDSNLSKIMRDDVSNYVHSLSLKSDKSTYELPAMKIQRLELKWKNKIISFVRTDLLALIKECWFQFRMYFSKYYYPINPYKLGVFGRSKITKWRVNNLLKEFNKNCEQVDLSRDYVYFALHYEPERTTNPDGAEFHDQAIAIAKLRELVPRNIDIFVKEHPTHFYRAKKGIRGRSPLLYDFISNIDGVKLTPQNESSLELIENSIFVATITGSAAFESAVMGKKALVFGDTWFNGCPNVTLWGQGLTFQEIFEKKISSPEVIKDFLLNEESLYSVPGCQNVSAQKKFCNYLDDNFSKVEFKGISHLLENYFLDHIRK